MSDSLVLALLDAALRGTVLGLLALLAAAFLRERAALPVSRIAVLMAAGLAVQVVSSAPLFEAHVPALWQAPLIGISVGNAVVFWVFAQALFDDEFVPRPWHAGLWAAVVMVTGLNCVVVAGSASVLAPALLAVQRAVPLVFAVLAATAAAAHWRSDLVESRRRLRAWIVVTGVGYALALLAARLASPHGRITGLTAIADMAALLFIVGGVAWRMLRVIESELFADAAPRSVAPARPAAPPHPGDDRLADTLQRVMATERPYLAEGFTVARLAQRLAVPEYRLRRLIHERLRHRNFNAYVNGFRLEDARAALADPARRETPVLAIALDAGFQSIGPFNRAFKAATGLTPTEFRRQSLADS
jgi:AraC-like DNA-binding protein